MSKPRHRGKRKTGMSAEDLKRFAADLRDRAGLEAAVQIDPKPEGMHVLHIHGVDFFFYADGSGYDGWGRRLDQASRST